MWFLGLVTFLVGAHAGMAMSGANSILIPTWIFVLVIVWVLTLGTLFLPPRTKDPRDLVFPWQLGSFIASWRTLTPPLSEEKRTSLYASIACVVLTVVVNLVHPDLKLLLLTGFLYLVNFIHTYPLFQRKVLAVNGVGATTLAVPLIIGYVLTAGSWPATDIIVIVLIYSGTMGIYFSAVGDGTARAKVLFLSSAVLGTACSVALAHYGTVYALAAVPLPLISLMSLRVYDERSLHRLHDALFYLAGVVWTLVGSYFFATHLF